MVRLRVFRVRVVVTMMMVVPVAMRMTVVMAMFHIQTTGPRAEGIAQLTGFHRGTGRVCTLPLDMMVMTFLHSAKLCLKT